MRLDPRPGFGQQIVKDLYSVDGEQKYSYTAVCRQEGCYFMSHLHTDEAGSIAAEAELDKHQCPTPYEESTMPTGKSISMKIWERGDELIDELMKAGDQDTTDLIKAELQGIVYCLHLMTGPYYQEPVNLKHQMMKRWKMRQGTVEQEPTPGYGGFNPPPIVTPAKPADFKPPPRKPAYKPVTIDEATSKKVLMMAGTMQPDQLVKMFKLDRRVIDEILKNKP